MIKTTHHFKIMIHKSYNPASTDKFILVTHNTLNDCINIPMRLKPTKAKNRSGFWKVKEND